MVEMTDIVCLLVPLLMLPGSAFQSDAKSVKEAEKTGNFMEDEQWLSTISQYSRKIKHWNRFRDEVEDDYVRTWDENQGSNDNVDTTKDPCQKVKCSRHKVCIAQGYQRAVCVNRKKLEHRLKQPALRSPDGNCQPCPISSSGPVCGSDGHNYASKCKLEQQACLTGKDLTLKCSGLCPCPTAAPTSKESKHESCTGQDLADLGERLRDWFQLLQTNAKQNNNSKSGARTTAASTTSVLDRSLVASCKDSIGWMFSKLDTNSDLYLDQAELAAINLDKYEVCIRPFFNSCDSYRDGKVSTAEWCLCFWREKPPCLAELERIQVKDGGKRKFGRFIPSCDEDGYYRKQQCDRGECWCVDQNGGEVAGSRIRGKPDCDDEMAYSGDLGSGVGWEDEEEKEAEETAEEAEEEEGEVGEVDDGGYIW
ncbi:testican-2 isoform X1 [Sparus aurata]|uniref:testican-2 isoform X1 n=1 Tax=Sparus aurata TaxID=8175 RepID=UPI0011C0FB58|nr:testican-2-like isoform X1 [Sparus aurata]